MAIRCCYYPSPPRNCLPLSHSFSSFCFIFDLVFSHSLLRLYSFLSSLPSTLHLRIGYIGFRAPVLPARHGPPFCTLLLMENVELRLELAGRDTLRFREEDAMG
jgi:hypothetical protein